MSQTPDSLNLLNPIKKLITPEEWTLDRDAIAVACTDWRKRYHTDALAVITPRTTSALQRVVAYCNEAKLAIATQGGNTGLVGGAVPAQTSQQPHIVLRTIALRDPITIDPANLTATVSAGHTLLEVQEAAEQAGYLFPLSLASEGTCTIGGNLASNAGGVHVLRYGNARELCIGLEFVSAQGHLCSDLRGLRKNNSGYDLRHLLIGSEGTLGIITRACLRLFPRPNSTVAVWFNVKNMQSGIDLLSILQKQRYTELNGFEWMNANSVQLVNTHFSTAAPGLDQNPMADHVLVEFTSLDAQEALEVQVEQTLEALLEQEEKDPIGVIDAFLSQSLGDVKRFWSIRENISAAQSKEGLNIKHDVACPVSRLPEFHQNTIAALYKTGLNIRPILFGHLGDGNLHYNLAAPQGEDSACFLDNHQEQLNNLVHEEIQRVNGTVSAEHGIGQLKAELLKTITPPPTYALYLSIKEALDPNQILNPGKLTLNA